MQKQTIKKLISAKVLEWIESVDDTELRHDLRKHILVSGGSIASMFLNEKVNDYDIYLQDRNTLLRITEYYVKKSGSDIEIFDEHKISGTIELMKSKGYNTEHGQLGISLRNLQKDQIKLFTPDGGYTPMLKKDVKYQVSFFSPNAISLTDDIQIVMRFFGTPEEIHKSFDFIHATNYFTFSSGVVTNLTAMESLIAKQLYYQGSLYPVTSIIRARKFIKRLWNINAGELLKIMFQISQLNLSDIAVLEEQLIGIDVAYFAMLIRILREHTERNVDFKMTPNYFNELIDRVFRENEEATEKPEVITNEDDDFPQM